MGSMSTQPASLPLNPFVTDRTFPTVLVKIGKTMLLWKLLDIVRQELVGGFVYEIPNERICFSMSLSSFSWTLRPNGSI